MTGPQPTGRLWAALLVCTIALAAFGALAYGEGGAWSRVVAAVEAPPETVPGMEAGRSLSALAALGPARQDYVAWQWLDLIGIALNAAVPAIAVLIGAAASGRPRLRALALLPVAGAALDLSENLLLGLMLAGAGGLEPLQQLATTSKLAVVSLSFLVGLAMLGLGLWSTVRRRAAG